jgi:hypothetical protein
MYEKRRKDVDVDAFIFVVKHKSSIFRIKFNEKKSNFQKHTHTNHITSQGFSQGFFGELIGSIVRFIINNKSIRGYKVPPS